MGPEEAAEELLARMLSAQRYRGAGAHLRELLAAETGIGFRGAPVPRRFRHAAIEQASGSADVAVLGNAIGGLLRTPPRISLRHMLSPRVTVAERLDHLRGLLRRGRFSFEEAVKGADRVTVAVTLLALLELYRRGEGDWEQSQPFGEITVYRPAAGASQAARPQLERAV